MVDQVGDPDALVLIELVDRRPARVAASGPHAVEEPHTVIVRGSTERVTGHRHHSAVSGMSERPASRRAPSSPRRLQLVV